MACMTDTNNFFFGSSLTEDLRDLRLSKKPSPSPFLNLRHFLSFTSL